MPNDECPCPHHTGKEIAYRCTGCGAEGVKLWREYQTIADRTGLYCVACAEKNQGKKYEPPSDQIGWLVPAVPADGGTTFWGYTSVPADLVKWWHDLPLNKADEYGPLGVDDWN